MSTSLDTVLARYEGTRPRPSRWRVSEGDTRLLQATVLDEEMTIHCLWEDASTFLSYLGPVKAWGRIGRAKLPHPPDISKWEKGPPPRSRWKNGDRVAVVLVNATCERTGRHFVVYRDDVSKVTWTCTIDSWLEPARFTPLADGGGTDALGRRT